MERTESVVIQVAPDYENDKIREMQMFGWNLQSRQEMHEEGDAYGRPSITGGSYKVTTKVFKYVKLHFVRSLDLPNLNRIKQIEDEFYKLPFPNTPSFIGPLIVIGLGIVGFLSSINKQGSGFAEFVVFPLILVVPGGFWLFSRIKKRQSTSNICSESLKRQQELINDLQSLA